MQRKMPGLLLCLLGLVPVQAGAIEGSLVFSSGFEDDDGCIVFNGLGQAVIIPTIAVSGDLTLNGGAFPVSEYDDAVFSLRDVNTGAGFPIGNSHDGNYSINIIPGRYDVLYDLETPNDNAEAPQNEGAVLMAAVPLFTSQTLDIDVTAYKIGGDFLLNNAAFPASEYDDANFHLDGGANGQVFLGNSHDQSYADVPVLAGTYQVRYASETPGANAPVNSWGYVTDVNITGTNGSLDLNVTSIDLDGDFLHNGVPFPALEYDDGTFWLETAGGDRVSLGNSHDLSIDTQLIPGTYDLYWELESLGNTVPFNKRARLASKVAVNGPTLDIDVISWPLDGDFLLNGGAFPNVEQQTGRILLQDKAAGVDDNELGKTFTGSYSRRVVQGTYAVVYQHLDGDQVPQNLASLLIPSLSISKARTVDIDVPASVFMASVFHNGVLFPNSQQQVANIFLNNPTSGDLAILGKTSEQHFSELIVPGTYAVYYSHIAGENVPANFRARIARDLVIEPPAPGPVLLNGGDTEFHVTSFVYTGNFYRNDVATPALEQDDGLVVLRRLIDEVVLGNTHDQSFSRRLIYDPEEDLFQVHYQTESAGSVMPINANTRIQCAKLISPPI